MRKLKLFILGILLVLIGLSQAFIGPYLLQGCLDQCRIIPYWSIFGTTAVTLLVGIVSIFSGIGYLLDATEKTSSSAWANREPFADYNGDE